jgi:hypothetical protein
MFDRFKRQQARACASGPEFVSEGQIGLMGCGLCSGHFIPITLQAPGISRIVGARCPACNINLRTDENGFLPPGGTR